MITLMIKLMADISQPLPGNACVCLSATNLLNCLAKKSSKIKKKS